MYILECLDCDYVETFGHYPRKESCPECKGQAMIVTYRR